MLVNPSSIASSIASAAIDVAANAAGQVVGARTGRAAGFASSVLPGSAPSEMLDPAVMRRLVRSARILRGGTRRAAVAGYEPAPRSAAAKATTSTSSSSTSKTSSSSLAFLSDPKLSIEEKLMRLMAHLNDKYEKEMQAKLDEFAGKDPKATSSSTSKKTAGGILGAIGSAVSSAIGGDAAKAISGFLKLPGVKSVLGQIGGPALAAAASALGFPAAAPLLLKYGPNVVDAVADVMSEAASSSSGSSGTSSSATSTSGTPGKTEQMTMMEVQRLMDKQKEMFSVVSNILRASHDTRMTAINNIR